MTVSMEYGLIGEHLPHSFSPEIHRELADYQYSIQELTPDEVLSFLEKRAFLGINVTIPYKRTVMPSLDVIDPIAREIGAVNTIVNRDGKLYGYNTDFYGMSALIAHAKVSVKGKKVLVLGTGGTSVTAVAVAKHLGASQVYRVSRHPEGIPQCISYDEAVTKHTNADIIINTTPVGMYPHIHGTPIELSTFSKLSGVFDAVYNPLRTDLIQQAQAMGVPAEGGLYMLVAQAAKAASLFLEDDTVLSKTPAVFATLMAQKENIVLIGMPSCGKTTVSQHLEDITGRTVFDTDALIVKAAEEEISSIFAREGEAGFRRREKQIIAEVAARSGCIIATGGGAILDKENVRQLKKNGRLVWLDRPLDRLIPTDDRPLASKKADIEALYAKRLSLYRTAADVRVDNIVLEDTVETIRRMWQQ